MDVRVLPTIPPRVPGGSLPQPGQPLPIRSFSPTIADRPSRATRTVSKIDSVPATGRIACCGGDTDEDLGLRS